MSEILTDPSNLARGLERMIGSERGASSGEDEASWFGRISETDAKQERLLDLRLDGDITPEQFRARSARLGEARVAAEAQLEAARSRLSRLKDIERSKDALFSHYASLVPRGLAELPPKREIGSTRGCACGSSPTATARSLPIGVVMSRLYLYGVS